MTLFWVVAACLVGAALLFVIPPLFLNGAGRNKSAAVLERSGINITIYKNQLTELETDLAAGDIDRTHYDKSREEIERRLLEDTAVIDKAAASSGKGLNIATTVVVALAVPLVAVSVYLKVGNPAAMDPAAQMAQESVAPHGQAGGDMQAQIEAMVGKLAQRLQENPSDIEGWVMLGRSFSVLGRYDEAVAAYEKSIQFVGEDATLLADYADAIAMSKGESLEGKPMELLQKALNIDPQNQKALWLLGTAHFERGDFTSAINLWKRLQQLIPAGSEDAQAMAANIAEAESYRQRQAKGEVGAAPTPAVATADAPAPAQQGASQITGKVTLSPALAAKVSPGDTLFVFAKAVSGPPMPLAIIRTQAGALPLEFKLDESQAMMPNMSLAKFNQVIVGARISKTGDAMPKSGDLQGGSKTPVAVGSTGLNIQIDTVVP
jgi:cytochrome c-type biogenesis protein CcmH